MLLLRLWMLHHGRWLVVVVELVRTVLQQVFVEGCVSQGSDVFRPSCFPSIGSRLTARLFCFSPVRELQCRTSLMLSSIELTQPEKTHRTVLRHLVSHSFVHGPISTNCGLQRTANGISSIFPLTVWKIHAVAAMFKSGGYRT